MRIGQRFRTVSVFMVALLSVTGFVAWPEKALAGYPFGSFFISAPPPGGTVGAGYVHAYHVTCRTYICRYNFVVTAGALPPGLSLVLGRIVGTPTTAGTYVGAVTARTTAGVDEGSQSFHIVIVEPTAAVITSGDPPAGSVGVPYQFEYTATGSTGVRYKVTSGALPPGLALHDFELGVIALIEGTPTTVGTYTGTVTATTGQLPDATQPFSIVIADAAPVITSGAPETGSVGTPYSFSITATGTTPITYSVRTGTLPDGLTLSASGLIEGVPTKEGTFAGTITASNGILPDATFAFTIVIAGSAAIITSRAPAGGTVGIPYSFNYSATGTPPISYQLLEGALPYGLTLSSSGTLKGTPTTAGTFTGVVTVSNGYGLDNQAFAIVIAAPEPPVITSAAPPGGRVGTPYTFTYTGTGSTALNYSVTAGALPPGLRLSAKGVLSGTPTAANTYVGTVTASSGVAPDASQDFFIKIVDAPPVITSGALPEGTTGSAYAFTYKATGGMPMAYSVTAGALPDGLTLSGDGIVSGTPSVAGTFTGAVTVSNGMLPNATQNFSINVQNTPVPGNDGSSGGGGGALGGLSLFMLLMGLVAALGNRRASTDLARTKI